MVDDGRVLCCDGLSRREGKGRGRFGDGAGAGAGAVAVAVAVALVEGGDWTGTGHWALDWALDWTGQATGHKRRDGSESNMDGMEWRDGWMVCSFLGIHPNLGKVSGNPSGSLRQLIIDLSKLNTRNKVIFIL